MKTIKQGHKSRSYASSELQVNPSDQVTDPLCSAELGGPHTMRRINLGIAQTAIQPPLLRTFGHFLSPTVSFS